MKKSRVVGVALQAGSQILGGRTDTEMMTQPQRVEVKVKYKEAPRLRDDLATPRVSFCGDVGNDPWPRKTRVEWQCK